LDGYLDKCDLSPEVVGKEEANNDSGGEKNRLPEVPPSKLRKEFLPGIVAPPKKVKSDVPKKDGTPRLTEAMLQHQNVYQKELHVNTAANPLIWTPPLIAWIGE